MIAPILSRRALVVIVFFTLLAVAGCSQNQAAGSPDLSSLTPSEALLRARQEVEAADGFRFSLSHVSGTTRLAGGLTLQQARGAVKRPGDMSLTAEANFGRAFVRTEAVVIGEQTWMTNPLTGTWAEIPSEDSPFGFLDPILVVANIIDNVLEPSFSGEPGEGGRVSVDGRIHASSFEPLVGVVADTTVDVSIQLDATNFQLVEARVRGVLQDGDAESAERLIELWGFNTAIHISAPI